MLLLLVYVGRVEKSLAFLSPRMVEGHGGRVVVPGSRHLAKSDTHTSSAEALLTEVPGKDEFSEVHQEKGKRKSEIVPLGMYCASHCGILLVVERVDPPCLY